MACPDTTGGHAGAINVHLVLGLCRNPSTAGRMGPLRRQRRRVADHRRPDWLRVRRADLQPAKPLRCGIAQARDPGRSDRGRHRQRAVDGGGRSRRRDPAALCYRVLPGRRLPASLQTDVHLVPARPRDGAGDLGRGNRGGKWGAPSRQRARRAGLAFGDLCHLRPDAGGRPDRPVRRQGRSVPFPHCHLRSTGGGAGVGVSVWLPLATSAICGSCLPCMPGSRPSFQPPWLSGAPR
jgi:hypothetical protein